MNWNLDEAIAYYGSQGAPRDQSAVIALLREIQQESGGAIPSYALTKVAERYEIKESFLLAIMKRIPSLRLKDQHLLEVCAGPNCGKHTQIAAAAEDISKKSACKITVKFMPCQRMCGKGPNVKLDGMIHHQMTEEKLRELVKDL